MCVRVCVHCGQLEPAVPPEKTALNFVENSANARQNAKIFSGAARRRLAARRREKKLRFIGKNKCDLAISTRFFEKKTGGGVFYVGPSRISGSGLRVRAAVGKIMLHKVPWALGEVS